MEKLQAIKLYLFGQPGLSGEGCGSGDLTGGIRTHVWPAFMFQPVLLILLRLLLLLVLLLLLLLQKLVLLLLATATPPRPPPMTTASSRTPGASALEACCEMR